VNKLIFGAILATTTLVLAPGQAGAQCAQCVIQTKAPSASVRGKFDYRVSCIIDISGDEVNTTVVAASDEEAIEMVRQTRC
jgi:hypothetical protein